MKIDELLTEEMLAALWLLEPSGREGVITHYVPKLGRVEVWVDACSEGADRGGYVVWYRLLDRLKPNGEAIVLESDADGVTIFFDGRIDHI